MITESRGLPPELIGKLGLRVSELLESKKEMLLTDKEAQLLGQTAGIDSIIQRVNRKQAPNESFFPNRIPFDWNEDQFGPLWIPKRNSTITLTNQNIPLYKKIIEDYARPWPVAGRYSQPAGDV